MATKKKNDTTVSMSRALEIVQDLLDNGNVSDADRNFVKKLYSNNSQFGNWFDDNVGEIVTLSKGRVKDAKDAYRFFGFTPRPRERDVGPGTQEMLTRSGKVTNQTGAWSDVELEESKLGNKTAFKATPKGGRTRTAGEVEAILRRGNAGTKKMSLEDQRIYDKLMADKQAKADAEQRDKANRALEKQRAADRAAKLQQLGIKDDGTLNDRQVEELLSRRDAEFKTNEEIRKAQEIENIKARAKAEESAAEEAKWRAANNIDPNDVVSDYQRKQINDGYKAWGYRPEDQRAIDDLEARLAEIYRGTSASEEDRANLSNQLEAYKGRVRKGLIDNPNGQNAEQMLAKAYRDENGVLWGKNSKGDLVKLDEPKETPEEKAAAKSEARYEQRRYQDQKRRDAYVKSRADSYMNEKVGGLGEDAEEPKYTYDKALELARKDALSFFGPADEDYGNVADLGIEEGNPEDVVQGDAQDLCPNCGSPLNGDGTCPNGDYTPDNETPVLAQQGHIKRSYL